MTVRRVEGDIGYDKLVAIHTVSEAKYQKGKDETEEQRLNSGRYASLHGLMNGIVDAHDQLHH